MAKHRANRRLIKQNFSYTAEEASRLLGVTIATVRRWLKNGLPHLTDQRPFLILGGDLRKFLEEQKKPKARCQINEFFCFRCRDPRPADGGMIDYMPTTALSGQLSAMCETCGTIMHKSFSASKLGALGTIAEVSFPHGVPRLTDMGKPRPNVHFE